MTLPGKQLVLWDCDITYKGMPKELKITIQRLKLGDIRIRTKGDLQAVVWKDKRDVFILTNIRDPPREGNLRYEHGNATKPSTVVHYNRHLGHLDKADRTASSFTASHRTWMRTGKLFCHQLDLAVLNTYIRLHVIRRKFHIYFRLALVRGMLARVGHEP
jgi:hypothetical protein